MINFLKYGYVFLKEVILKEDLSSGAFDAPISPVYQILCLNKKTGGENLWGRNFQTVERKNASENGSFCK
jgi:hypothetical protein